VVLDIIVSRTLNGMDKNNKKFKKYTKEYAEIKGTDVSDVDLTFSGDMLDSLELVSHKSGEIVIGYKEPSEELAGKVEGNRRGTYGQSKPIPGKARDFLGISQSELDTIIDSYKEDEPAINDLSADELDALARQIAEEMFS